MATGKFAIQGMKGAEDAERVTSTLRSVWGIQEVALQPDKAEVTFHYDETAAQYDETAAQYDDFKTALLDQGFGVKPLDEAGIKGGTDQLGHYL